MCERRLPAPWVFLLFLRCKPPCPLLSSSSHSHSHLDVPVQHAAAVQVAQSRRHLKKVAPHLRQEGRPGPNGCWPRLPAAGAAAVCRPAAGGASASPCRSPTSVSGRPSRRRSSLLQAGERAQGGEEASAQPQRRIAPAGSSPRPAPGIQARPSHAAGSQASQRAIQRVAAAPRTTGACRGRRQARALSPQTAAGEREGGPGRGARAGGIL